MSSTACMLCALIWALSMLGGTAYLIFWRGANGWWMLLAFVLACAWNCVEDRPGSEP
jgi:hypothetical protein